MTFRNMFRLPSAFVPLTMSTLAMTTIAVHIALHGIAPQPDEGAAAHIWQLLMAAQIPIVAVFTIRWLPQSPRAGFAVLLLQMLAVATAAAPVYLLGW